MKKVEPGSVSPIPRAAGDERPLVLYVEDEEQNWNITELRLRNRYQLLRAATDQEACEVVRTHGERLHAVLMDIQLKGSVLDGLKLTALFKGKIDPSTLPAFAQNCPTLKAEVFFVTAYGSRYAEHELRALGGHSLITKPVDFVRLSLALAQASAEAAAATAASAVGRV